MKGNIKLSSLLPAIYRLDVDAAGCPMCSLLEVIEEQMNVIEDDIGRLYDNWFIETCQDWVVPYLGDLIGYNQAGSIGSLTQGSPGSSCRGGRVLVPRRDVANTIRNRRRKGTQAVLESVAEDVSGWTVRAVEMYRALAFTQNLNHLRTDLGRSADLHKVGTIGRPFNGPAHLADLRSKGCDARGYNTNSVGLFIWRLKPYSVTMTPAEESGLRGMFTFSALGDDTPLYNHPDQEATSGLLGVPTAIGRRAFESRKEDFYGEGKSILIRVGTRRAGGNKNDKDIKSVSNHDISWQDVPSDDIIPANLSRWQYAPEQGKVAVDPELGRIAFSQGSAPARVLVSYYYGFSDDIGGGEYSRPIYQPRDFELYQVGNGGLMSITQALEQWQSDKEKAVDEARKKHLLNAVIEITESGVYTAPVDISLGSDEGLYIRAANRIRPIVRARDLDSDRYGNITVTGDRGSSFAIDGLILSGGGVSITGDLARAAVRHSTIVPGHELQQSCEPERCSAPGLDIFGAKPCVHIDHSIMGPIRISGGADPVNIHIADSILDASSSDHSALSSSRGFFAPAVLTIKRSTVLGNIYVHAISLAEDTIFRGFAKVARTQMGCMRFCYVPRRASRTPKRYNCQPDMVIARASEGEEYQEALRVRPQFKSINYGEPEYCRLSDDCAEEIGRGSGDESEMGVFHDLYEPQRRSNLESRLEDYLPAGMNSSLVFLS